jgi:hypothetical protein
MIGQTVAFSKQVNLLVHPSGVIWQKGEIMASKLREVVVNEPSKPTFNSVAQATRFKYFYLIKCEDSYYERMEDEVYILQDDNNET